MSLIRAFNLTISTKDDVSDDTVKKVTRWITKSCSHFLVVCENDTGKRHLHAALFFSEPKDKKKLRENIWQRYVKDNHPTSIGKFAVHMQASPGAKWVSDYLHKDANKEEIAASLPFDLHDLDEFYPCVDEQALLMKATDKVVDVFYANHEATYKEWLSENSWFSSTQTAHEYFCMRMFVAKDMRVIADSRRVHQMSVALHKYSVESYKLTNLEISIDKSFLTC